MNLTFGLSVAAVGILVVFSGLVLLIICLKILELLFKDRKKATPEAETETTPVAAAPTPPPAQAQTTSGISPEVIAAITAAISAVWQEDSGFVVRRVRRIHTAPAWNRAGRDDQIYSRL